MTGIKNFIDLTLVAGGQEIRIKTYPGEYADLRLLIKEYLNHDDEFGQCGGMGRCATCMVVISSNKKAAGPFSNRLLNRHNNHPVVLSCQVVVNDDLANKVISVQ